MKTLVLFNRPTDHRPVVIANSTETTVRTKYYLMDKWRQKYDILCGHDKVLDETFYAVEVNGSQYHAESMEDLFNEMREYHHINVVDPFDYE